MQQSAEELMDTAIEQLQMAAAQMRQQHSMEAKMWQKTAQELQTVVNSLQIQLQESEKANAQLRLCVEEKSAEIEKLQAMNVTLTKTLQQKEQAIAGFVSFNQSLKGLIEKQESPMIVPPQVTPVAPSFEYNNYETPTKPAIPSPAMPVSISKYRQPPVRTSAVLETPVQPVETPKPTASKSSLFIKAAKQELTYSDFNQMINEINMYNRHHQTREDTIENVKKLLCPSHRGLFDQFLPMISGI